jgi:hypothetical protein
MDIGYSRTRYRMWSSITLAHNTVMVDRMNQDGTRYGNTKGNVTMFYNDEQVSFDSSGCTRSIRQRQG